MSFLFNKIVDPDNVEYSYGRCMLGKTKYKKDAIMFDEDKTHNVDQLVRDIKNGTYTPSEYYEFEVYEPKRRIIHAPSFRDKLAQRMVYNVLKDIYSNVFIGDSFACIVGKGTHAASDTIHRYLRKAKWEYGDCAFIVKLDIQKFFYSIDRELAKTLYRKKINCKKALWLLDRIIDSAPGETGLPLGNITSHTFANIVGNEIDQYCKRYLGIKYYVRYMDDICIILPSKIEARKVFLLCKRFIERHLNLKLNSNKSKLFPIQQGVNFVGFKTWSTHKLLRGKSKRKIKSRLHKIPALIKSGKITIEKAEQMINSWYGHARHGSHCNFLNAIYRKHDYLYDAGGVIKIMR